MGSHSRDLSQNPVPGVNAHPPKLVAVCDHEHKAKISGGAN